MELVEFSDDIYRAIGEAAKDVLARAGDADPLTRRVYDSFMAFRKKAVEWTRLSDQSHANERALTDFS